MEIQDAAPLSRLLAEDRITLVARPSNITAARYPEVSAAVQRWAYQLLTGAHEQNDAYLQGLARELDQMRQPDGGW